MNYNDYREIVNAVIDGDLDGYEGYKQLDNASNVDVVYIICHRINEGDIVSDIADDLSSCNAWAWRDCLQSVYDYDVERGKRM